MVSSPEEVSDFAAGDRVVIVGAHPWRGRAGTIAGPFPASGDHGLDWIVSLDDICVAPAVSERNLRHAPR